MIAGTVNISVIGIIFKYVAFFLKVLSVAFEILFSSSFCLDMSCACQDIIILWLFVTHTMDTLRCAEFDYNVAFAFAIFCSLHRTFSF